MTVQPAVRLWLLARRWRTARIWVSVSIACTAIGAVFLLWNLDRSPDTQYDEVVYSRADQAVAQDWRLTWTNRPLFVHPPLSFLIQAAWLHLRGAADRSLIEVIEQTRLLAGLTSVGNVVLMAMLTYRLIPSARPRRRVALTLLTALLTATDPLLVRYGRMAMIEPLALLSCLVVLHAALTLRGQRASVYVPVLGMLTGLSLLTNEICIFMLLTPAVYALIDRDRALLRRSLAVLAAGVALWSVFLVWSMQLGLFGSFFDVKTVTLQRLIGSVQVTGWNRPGVSFIDGLATQVGQYAGSYIVLAVGAAAMVWLMVHHGGHGHRFLLAWLITSYAFGAYTVLLGTINEQFFVYVVPAALVASVLVAEAVFGRRMWSSAVALVAIVGVLSFSVGSWVRFSTTRNDGLARLTSYAATHLPACETLNTTGDFERFQLLMPNRPVASYATGPAALSHGVNLFVLSDKDAQLRFGNASPALNSWVRAHGTRLAAYPSATYQGLELWRVAGNPYDPAVGVERYPGGDFVITAGSRCGGFPVVDGRDSALNTGWRQVGGMAVAGAPLTAAWRGQHAYQVFQGAVLKDPEGAPGPAVLPVVATLAAEHPVAYRAADLPPLAGWRTPPATVRLSDPLMAAAYRGKLAELLGPPLGYATRMADGMVRQAFAGGVLEHAPRSSRVRLSPIGRVALEAGIVDPSAAARSAVTPPALHVDSEPPQPTTVEPFFWTLAAALALYAAIFTVVVARRMTGGNGARAATAGAAIGTAAVQPPGGSPAPPAPALGQYAPVRRRVLVARISVLMLLSICGLGVRASGILKDPISPLPAIPNAAPVIPGVARSGQPKEADFVRVRDDYGVRAIIAVEGRDDAIFSRVEEKAIATSLGMEFLHLRVSPGAALTPQQTKAVAGLLSRQRPSEHTSPSLVLVHDRTGTGPVNLVSAAIQILDRQPAASVLDPTTPYAAYRFEPRQRAALRQLSDAIAGAAEPGNPYGSLRHQDW
jgi:hypothetical protein